MSINRTLLVTAILTIAITSLPRRSHAEAGRSEAQAGQGQLPSPLPLSLGLRERGSSVSPAFEGWYRDKDGGVNLLALSAPESGGGDGVIRLLVANRDQAANALAKAGYTFQAEEVLFVEVKNRPGALAKAVEKLAKANINVRYAYATSTSRTHTTAAVIAVGDGDLPKAVKLLG